MTFPLAKRFEQLAASSVDALALGVYAVVGAQKALATGLSATDAILVGAINATGGGLIRDVLVRDEPLFFKPGWRLKETIYPGGISLPMHAWSSIRIRPFTELFQGGEVTAAEQPSPAAIEIVRVDLVDQAVLAAAAVGSFVPCFQAATYSSAASRMNLPMF